MSTKSYSNVKTIEKEIEYLGRRLDKYAKFYWRGEDMWETYHTFITNNGSALKFVNGPSFTNEYSSPQYDHATGNLTGVKFSRMQVSFTICSYGVTIEQYRSLVSALGPYEIDYLAFDYDNKLCYLAKTIGMKEAVKYVVGTNKDGKDLYLVENTVTFEVQGEQCAIAQRQYVWTPQKQQNGEYQNSNPLPLFIEMNSTDMLVSSELSFGIVSEVTINNLIIEDNSILQLFIASSDDLTDKKELCSIIFNPFTKNWQNQELELPSETPSETQSPSEIPSEIQSQDRSISLKYDSVSGLVFMQYGEADYKILNLLLTNTAGEYLISDMKTKKMKIEKGQDVSKIAFIWQYQGVNSSSSELNNSFNPEYTKVYGRAKAILV